MIRGALILVAMFIAGGLVFTATTPLPFPYSLLLGVAGGGAAGWIGYDLHCREVIRWFNAGVRAGRGVDR